MMILFLSLKVVPASVSSLKEAADTIGNTGG